MHWYCCIYSKTSAFQLKISSLPSNRPPTSNQRFKRDSGIIPFRPLFVYRQQQKELQAKWKLIEALKQQKKQAQLKLQLEAQNQQNIVYHSNPKLTGIPKKLESTYRHSTEYPFYQATSTYQTNQKYQNYQEYPIYQTYPLHQQDYIDNSYETYSAPTYTSYSTFGQSYADQQDAYYSKYISGYYS